MTDEQRAEIRRRVQAPFLRPDPPDDDADGDDANDDADEEQDGPEEPSDPSPEPLPRGMTRRSGHRRSVVGLRIEVLGREGHEIQVRVNGTVYESLTKASKQTGWPYTTLATYARRGGKK